MFGTSVASHSKSFIQSDSLPIRLNQVQTVQANYLNMLLGDLLNVHKQDEKRLNTAGAVELSDWWFYSSDSMPIIISLDPPNRIYQTIKLEFETIEEVFLERVQVASELSTMASGPYLPESLLQKYQEALRRARAYREQHGDPVDGLVNMLGSDVDADTWRAILDEPYG